MSRYKYIYKIKNLFKTAFLLRCCFGLRKVTETLEVAKPHIQTLMTGSNFLQLYSTYFVAPPKNVPVIARQMLKKISRKRSQLQSLPMYQSDYNQSKKYFFKIEKKIVRNNIFKTKLYFSSFSKYVQKVCNRLGLNCKRFLKGCCY